MVEGLAQAVAAADRRRPSSSAARSAASSATKSRRTRKTVTLNKEKFLAERAELNADKEEEEMFDDLSDPNRPVFRMDDYDKEALDITVDYLDLLGGHKIADAKARPATQPAVASCERRGDESTSRSDSQLREAAALCSCRCLC